MARPSRPWFRASKGTWYVTVNGKKVSLGVQGRENPKAAEESWHKLMAGVALSSTPVCIEGPTVADVVTQFLADSESRVKSSTARYYRDFLAPFAKKYGQLMAADLAVTTAEAYSRRPEWSPSTRNDFLTTLAGAFRWAERARLVDRSPLIGLRRPPKTSRGPEAPVTAEEHKRLLAAATPQFRLILQLLYVTGARPGEVAAITAENFDPEAGLVRLKEHKTAHKGKARVIYLTPEGIDLLLHQRERYPTGPLLRNGRGKPWVGWAIIKAMAAARKGAGLVGKISYGYRHTFATDALAKGVPDAQVAELLGHSGTGMLHRHYSHLAARSAVLKDALGNIR